MLLGPLVEVNSATTFLKLEKGTSAQRGAIQYLVHLAAELIGDNATHSTILACELGFRHFRNSVYPRT